MDNHNHLTPSELRLLALVADGLSNKGIADRLGRTQNGVEVSLSNLYNKLALSPEGNQRVAAAIYFLHGNG